MYVNSTVHERKTSQVMYSSTAVLFRLLGYSSGRVVTSDIILLSSNTRGVRLLREFSKGNLR